MKGVLFLFFILSFSTVIMFTTFFPNVFTIIRWGKPTIRLADWRWQSLSRFDTLDFGPYHLAMLSSTERVQPELFTYVINGRHGVLKTLNNDPMYRFTWSLKRLRLNPVNSSTFINFRALQPSTSRYGWYLDDGMDSVAMVATKQRAAWFNPQIPKGTWVAIHEANFNFLNGFMYGNQTLIRI